MKPLVKTVATTAVVLSALAGCASRSSGGSSTSAQGAGNGASSSSSSTSQAPSTSPSSPSSTSSSGDATVKYVSPEGVSVEKDGITLVTEVEWGGCNEQPQLVVTSQDASKVVVELKTVSHFKTGIMCPDFATRGSATVKLAAPLGSRQLVDGVKNVAISVG